MSATITGGGWGRNYTGKCPVDEWQRMLGAEVASYEQECHPMNSVGSEFLARPSSEHCSSSRFASAETCSADLFNNPLLPSVKGGVFEHKVF
jgi:hypothetical protein